MIGNIVYALKWLADHPVQALAFTIPFGITTFKPIADFRYAMARIAVHTTGRFLLDSGDIGKIFYEEFTRPKGAPRPPLYRGTELQKAVKAGKKRALTPITAIATRIAPAARLLLASRGGFYGVAAITTITAGYAIGRTHVVRTAPSEKGQAGMMMGTW